MNDRFVCPITGQTLIKEDYEQRRYDCTILVTEDGQYRYHWYWNENALHLDGSNRVFKFGDGVYIEYREIFGEYISLDDPYLDDRQKRYDIWVATKSYNGNVFASSLGLDMVSVQPMSAPFTSLFYLDFIYGKPETQKIIEKTKLLIHEPNHPYRMKFIIPIEEKKVSLFQRIKNLLKIS